MYSKHVYRRLFNVLPTEMNVKTLVYIKVGRRVFLYYNRFYNYSYRRVDTFHLVQQILINLSKREKKNASEPKIVPNNKIRHWIEMELLGTKR